METNVLEKAGSLAAEKLKVIQAPAVAKAEAESKVAAENLAKADEQKKKDEGEKLAKLEAQTKEDERILTVEDKDLSEPELARKAELKETKRKKDESPDEKIRRVQEASQKRIDEIKSELLAKENKSNKTIATLQAELDGLKKAIQPRVEEDAKIKLKREETERITKYIEEDRVKPREERREISKDELDEWFLEEPVEATAWMQERTLRRHEERKDSEAKIKDEETKGRARVLSEEFITKQNASRQILYAKYPGVNPSAEKIASLKGKTNAEIREALCAESEEFRLCTEIVAENPKFLESENGPELIMAEMEKRLAEKPEKELTVAEQVAAGVQAELDRLALLDGEGANSSTKGKRRMDSNQNKSAQRQHLERIAKKAKIPMADLDKTIQRRETISGASQFNIEGVDEG